MDESPYFEIHYPKLGKIVVRDRGRLPHWEYESGLYAVNFHLADSLPQPVLTALKAHRDGKIESLKKSGRTPSPLELLGCQYGYGNLVS